MLVGLGCLGKAIDGLELGFIILMQELIPVED
jgi:hypothetical protein